VDKRSFDNWHRLKESLEREGKTDAFYYKRACYIVQNGRDPGLKMPRP